MVNPPADPSRRAAADPQAAPPAAGGAGDLLPATDGKAPAAAREQHDSIQETYDLKPDQTDPTRAPHESLISTGEQTEDFLGGSVNIVHLESDVPGQIENFRILNRLGSGGFGTVYAAEDIHLERRVAIKVIKSTALAQAQVRANFKEEARAAAQLRHPNIVPVYQSGDYGEDRVFIVFGYIAGPTLRQILRHRKVLPPREAATLLAKVADALGYAHHQGIVHRDIKPENILLHATDQEPHVADFGCARRQESTHARASSGRENVYVGTLPYFSPEQAQGRADEADATADVWALGVVMYELLSGRRPFREFETGRGALFHAICHVPPASLREANRRIDRDLDAICRRCLAKSPAARYATAAELAQDLRRYLRGQPVSARPIRPAERTWRWARRNPLMAALAATVLLSITVGFAVSSFFWARVVRGNRVYTQAQVERLIEESPERFASILDGLREEPFRGFAVSALRSKWSTLQTAADDAPQARGRERVALALNELQQHSDPTLRDAPLQARLAEEMFAAEPAEFELLRTYLRPAAGATALTMDQLWATANADEELAGRRLRALAALAAYAPQERQWEALDDATVQLLLTEGRPQLAEWARLFAPARHWLQPGLRARFCDEDPTSRRLAALTLAEMLLGTPEEMAALIASADASQLAELLPRLRRALDRLGKNSPSEIEAFCQLIGASRMDAEDAELTTETDSSRLPESQFTTEFRDVNATITGLYLVPRLEQVAALAELASDLRPAKRAELAHRLALAGISLERMSALLTRLCGEATHPRELAVVLLALGERNGPLAPSRRDAMQAQLQGIYDAHPDAEVHAAARWVLEQWGMLPAEDSRRPAAAGAQPAYRKNSLGMTFVKLSTHDSFSMGSTPDERSQFGDLDDTADEAEWRHERAIPRTFEIGTDEVTLADFRPYLEFRVSGLQQRIEARGVALDGSPSAEWHALPARMASLMQAAANLRGMRAEITYVRNLVLKVVPQLDPVRSSSGDWRRPVVSVSWYDVVAYCEWLSAKEGLPACYGSLDDVELARQGHKLLRCDLTQGGYRLPTIGEWEYVARGRSALAWPCGSTSNLLPLYAWFQSNSDGELHCAGQRKPNRFGLFDTLGNAREWCDDQMRPYPRDRLAPVVDGVGVKVEDKTRREVRGGSFAYAASRVRPAERESVVSRSVAADLGFRIARTVDAKQGEGSP